jgi:hypothetical protein
VQRGERAMRGQSKPQSVGGAVAVAAVVGIVVAAGVGGVVG